MKKVNFLIVLILFFSLVSGSTFAQKQIYPSKSKDGKTVLVDDRIDNMGYWKKMAEKGLVPVAPVVTIPEAVFTGSEINAKSVKNGKEDSPDVPVSNATNVTESENSSFVDPTDNNFILNSNNSTSWSGGFVGTLYGANHFESEDAGLTWGGSAQGAGGSNSGDPTTAINFDGSRMYINYISNSGGMGISYSTNNGSSWSAVNVAPNPGSLADKNHMWIDNSPLSPNLGNLYIAWTDFGGANDSEIVLKKSSNGGTSWGTLINVSSAVNAGSHNQGVNIQTGPNGEVYVIWSIYDSWPQDEKAIGFAKSTNGGTSFGTAVRIINNTRGIRNSGVGKNMRVNSFPSMAVDISGGSYNGNIYVVWTNIGVPGVNSGTSADVYMIRSTDQGATWSSPIKVNQDAPGLGKKHYFPWIACDPETGVLSVIFYDDRNVSGTQCEVWCANSMDGGDTWEDFKVSDVAFTPTPIPGLAPSYMGDYISISSRGGNVYPIWTDTRNNKFMTYVSPYTTFVLIAPAALSVNLDDLTGATTLNWSFGGAKPFLYFNIYRDGDSIGSTPELFYNDILPDYGIYNYGVTAVYDEGESIPVTDSIQWGNPDIFYTPDQIDTSILVGTSAIKSITLKNLGELELDYTVTAEINNKKSSKVNTSAKGGCDEYISGVIFGDINNSSSCDGYSDYTYLSTVVNRGWIYTITVTNGNAYSSDDLSVWIDWNQDMDFSDNGEQVICEQNNGGQGSFEIAVPETALAGKTRLRVRIDDNPNNCGNAYGTSTYGEVEDYSILVTEWLSIDNTGGTIAPGDSAIINVTLDAAELSAGNYSANIIIESNDPDLAIATIPVTLSVGEDFPEVTAWADPAEICSGDSTQLFADATGGMGVYTYSWTSVPEGFISTEQQPVVTPIENTLYIVEVNDGLFSVSDSTEVIIAPMPGMASTPTGNTAFCINPVNTTYTSEGAEFALSYIWALTPETAGIISGGGNAGIVDWNSDFTGEAYISVTGVNECGTGTTSEMLAVIIHPLPEVTFASSIDTVYTNTPEFALTAGQPAGGTYSGNGVTETGGVYFFNAAVAGVGEHTLVYTFVDGNGCENFATDLIYVKQWMGINKIMNGIQIEIYPNPSKGSFTLKLNSDRSEILSLKIVNNLGKSVFEETNINPGVNFSRMIDLTDSPEGLYFLNLFSNETSYTEKIVIRK